MGHEGLIVAMAATDETQSWRPNDSNNWLSDLAFSVPVIWFVFVRFRIFHPCNLVRELSD